MENSKPNNPNAFPYGYGTDNYDRSQDGMTLRDYFAAKAMQSIINSVSSISGIGVSVGTIVESSYTIADEMLKHREL